MALRSASAAGEPADRTMYLAHRARIATAEAVAGVLSDLRLNGSLGLILETLLELGEASAAELARRCLVTRQALTAPLNELQDRGLVHRGESAAGAKIRPVTLTVEGRALTEIVRDRTHRLERAAEREFTDDELATLRILLDKYAVGWERLATQAPVHPAMQAIAYD